MESQLTALAALRLIALGPCLFVAFFLAFKGKDWRSTVLVSAYFLSLACAFVYPFFRLSGDLPPNYMAVKALLLYGESFGAALSFLLISQALLRQAPNPFYWLILAVPAAGGMLLTYAHVYAPDTCFTSELCVPVASMHLLYNVFGAALIFLLLIIHFSRKHWMLEAGDPDRDSKYWLAMTLIFLNLLLLVNDLANLANKIAPSQNAMIETVLRMGFVYLAFSSVLRVFSDAFAVAPIAAQKNKPQSLREDEKKLEAKIRSMLEEEHVYRDMEFSREWLASKLATGEHTLSRVVNVGFGKSLTEVVNGYRIAEAKQRLTQEKTPITVIAFDVGFRSIASFNRVFKQAVGCSPTEFRERA